MSLSCGALGLSHRLPADELWWLRVMCRLSGDTGIVVRGVYRGLEEALPPVDDARCSLGYPCGAGLLHDEIEGDRSSERACRHVGVMRIGGLKTNGWDAYAGGDPNSRFYTKGDDHDTSLVG